LADRLRETNTKVKPLSKRSAKISKLQREKKKLESHVSLLRRQNVALKDALSLSNEELKTVLLTIDSLMEKEPEEAIPTTTTLSNSPTAKKFQRNTYSAPIRKCVYNCLLNQVD
jgi:seryl-tRNA synthetase